MCLLLIILFSNQYYALPHTYVLLTSQVKLMSEHKTGRSRQLYFIFTETGYVMNWCNLRSRVGKLRKDIQSVSTASVGSCLTKRDQLCIV